jgi:hypothetical protein
MTFGFVFLAASKGEDTSRKGISGEFISSRMHSSLSSKYNGKAGISQFEDIE